ncbi:MAG: hypothetical protein K0Q55_3562 [Verrucomicrobia bacterium]|nr:hypothetical protein [Verrucomicrobiota bacterium]
MNFFSNTRTLKIFGAKDYLVCLEGGIASDAGNELNALTHPLLREHGYFGILHLSISDQEPGLYIHPIYSGNWSFAVSPDQEDGPMPLWPIKRSWGTINQHSETLEIEVPKSARLYVLAPVESQPKEGT